MSDGSHQAGSSAGRTCGVKRHRIGTIVGLGVMLALGACGAAPVSPAPLLVVVRYSSPLPVARTVSVRAPEGIASASPAMPVESDSAPALPSTDAPVYAEKRDDPYHLRDVAVD